MLFALIKKEFEIIWADKASFIFLFVLPIVFIVMMNTALGATYEEGEASVISLPVVNLDQGAEADKVIKAINDLDSFELFGETEDEKIDTDKINRLVKDNKYEAGIIFPQDFSDQVREGEVGRIEFLTDPATSEQVLVPIQSTISGVASSQIGQEVIISQIENITKDIPEQFRGMVDTERINQDVTSGFNEQLVELEKTYPDGMTVKAMPNASEQHVPGYAIMFVFFIMNGIVEALMEERAGGLFRRIVASPVSRPAILFAKVFPYYVVNILQIVVMFAVGVIFFGMDLGGSILGLILVTLALPLVSTSLGIFISTITKTKNQGVSIAVICTLILSAIGGLFVPAFLLPEPMQVIANYTPFGAALNGYQDVIVRGFDVSGVWDNVLILAVYAVIFFSFAIWKFKFEEN